MVTKNEIKRIKSLHQKRERWTQKKFIAEGVKIVKELQSSGFDFQAFGTEEIEGISDLELVSTKDLERMSGLSSPNKVLAVCEFPEWQLDTSKTSIVIDGANDPGNLGTIIRTADWFGIDQIICSKNSVDCFNSKVIMATMGAITRVKIFYLDLEEFLNNSELPSYGAFLEGKSIRETDFPSNCNLVFGSESHGIGESLKPLIQNHITIPKIGKSESLNLAISVGIITSQIAK